MSVAPRLAVGTTLISTDDTWFSVFQSLNAPSTTQLVCGNFFLGLQGYIAVRIDMGSLLGLDRGAPIETGLTPAAVSFVADSTWTAGGAIECNVVIDDSPRQGPLDSRLAWKPPGGITNIWRQDTWGVFDQVLEDTGGTPFLDTGLGTIGVWAILLLVGLRERIGARFVVPAGPDWSVARAILELRRVNNPTGSMEVAIQANGTNAVGINEPDGIDLGVSASVLNSTVVLTPGSGPITFAFTPDVVLPPGTYWTVLRPDVAYVADFTNVIVWMQQRLFFGVGGAHFHGSFGSNRFDIANYPGHIDVHRDMLAKELGPSITWNPIARVAGQTISTPDLSPLVQEVIRTSGHETISALCFTFRTIGETRTYRFASNDHATANPPGFACQFRRRDIRGEVL